MTPPEGTRAVVRSWHELFRDVFGPSSRRILDIECGEGDVALLLFALGHFPHGADSSPERVRLAQSRADARCAAVSFRVSDPDDLRFPACAFEGVHARDLFSTVMQPGPVLMEWYRVLRPGGTALVVESSAERQPAALLRDAGFVELRERDLRLPRRCDPHSRRSEPWYRRWATPSLRYRIAWGRRP